MSSSLTAVAKETLAAIENGEYRSASGAQVRLRELVDRAVQNTVLYTPEALDRLLARRPIETAVAAAPRCEVTGETTAEAARRLVEVEAEPKVAALNFASAKNPGGGFLSGAKSQEEDLARTSALYPCLVAQGRYYDANRAHPSLLYTDQIIYSPEVPFFRDERLEWMEAPFLVSMITAPAPNAGEYLRREPDGLERVHAALESRAEKVLVVAQEKGHRCLVLGAWGCGVFRNDPKDVAEVFAHWLMHPRFAGAFDRIVFAVYDRSAGAKTRRAFEDRFGAHAVAHP